MARLQRITAPVGQPLTWNGELDTHLRVDSEEEKGRVLNLVLPAATSMVEDQTNRALITQTWRLDLDGFPGQVCSPYFKEENGHEFIAIPKPPCREISSIAYVATDGTTVTWDDESYVADLPVGQGDDEDNLVYDPKCSYARIYLAYGERWPVARNSPNSVSITFECGYGATGARTPPALKQAILLTIAEAFERREHGNELEITTVPLNMLAWTTGYLVEI